MEMNTELVCVMASLGYGDGEDYFKGVDCLESLKDMIRFLRHEDLQICDIRRQMGHAKVLQNDLIPLLVCNPDDKELSDIILRLLVNLTSAPHLCFEQNPVEEVQNTSPERKAHELQLMTYLQAYKEAFSQKSAMSAISSHLGRILQCEPENREEEDNLLLERILLLIRNLLYVPADPDDEKRTEDDVTIHDQLLWSLHENGIDDLLIYISSADSESNWCMHACEIISHMFREQNAEELAKASEIRSLKEKEEDTKTLKTILAKERQQKGKMIDHRGSRHSRFGGSFWVKDRKALKEDMDLVYHRTLQSAKDMTYDFDKMPERKRKVKLPLNEKSEERKSTLSVRMFLKDFCVKFLEDGYNNLMSSVKASLDARRTQKNDESFYLAVMRFFMTFNRVYDFKVDYVSQTFGVQIFGFILNLLIKYSDNYDVYKPTKDRDLKIQYSRRIHLALKALKELLMYVAIMLKSRDENLMPAAEVIQSNIFYIEEYRNIFLTLLRGWSAAFQTRVHLKDLIEAFHLYLKLFESFLSEKGTFLTHSTKVQRKVKKTKKKPSAKRCPIEITAQLAESLWQDEVSVMLSARIQGRDGGIPDLDMMPFDAISEVPIEEQKIQALATVQRLLRCKQPGEAIAFLRASRDCWPEESKFGATSMSGEEEFMCLREIYFMEFPSEILQCAEDNLKETEIEEMQEDIVEEQVEEESRVVKQGEKVFELQSFLKMLARPFVVMPYCYLLKSYNQNQQHTNHCIIKMLHRIAVDLKTYPMLFQLSLFLTFKKILNEPNLDSNKEMKGFAKFILSKFFQAHQSNPMVVIELLFWKSNTECYEIIEGYGSLDARRNQKKFNEAGRWTFEEEEELMALFEELKDADDVVEKITERLAASGRTSKHVRNKLVRLHLIEKARRRKANEWTEDETDEIRRLYEEFKETDDVVEKITERLAASGRTYKHVKNRLVHLNLIEDSRRRKVNEWTEDETDEIRRLYEEFKETDDPLENIKNSMTFNKSKKVITARLLEIDLVQDKRDLHKKRKKKIRPNNNDASDGDDDLVVDENWEEGEDGGLRNRENASRDGSGSDNNLSDSDDDDDDNRSMPFSSSLANLLKDLCSLGFQNEISWIRGRLVRLANDRENMDEDDWQSVPLVSITEDHENALSNKIFRKMLKRIGIAPPADEQEIFWRISRTLSPSELREFAEDLDKYSSQPKADVSRTSATDTEQLGASTSFKNMHGNDNHEHGDQANGDQEESDDEIFERFLTGSRGHSSKSLETGANESGPSTGTMPRDGTKSNSEHVAGEQLNGYSGEKGGAEAVHDDDGATEIRSNASSTAVVDQIQNRLDSGSAPSMNGSSKASIKRNREAAFNEHEEDEDFGSDEDVGRIGKRRRKLNINDDDGIDYEEEDNIKNNKNKYDEDNEIYEEEDNINEVKDNDDRDNGDFLTESRVNGAERKPESDSSFVLEMSIDERDEIEAEE